MTVSGPVGSVPGRRRKTLSEQREVLRMLLRDAWYQMAVAVRWHAMAESLDCPRCHLLGVAKTGPCPTCRPVAAEFYALGDTDD